MIKNPGSSGASSGTLAAPSTISATPAANTSTDGLILTDPTAAAAASQQFSPSLRLTGQGWGTTTPASAPVDWIIFNQPVQGTTNPTSDLRIASQINGGGYTNQLTLLSGAAGAVFAGTSSATAFVVTGGTLVPAGIYLPGANALGFSTNSVAAGLFDANGNFITLKAHCDQSKSVQSPTTGFAITAANNTSTLYLTPAGTLATGTITFAAAPVDGQEFQVGSSQIITALTLAGNGSTISNAPSTIATAGSGFKYIYNTATTTWLRLY